MQYAALMTDIVQSRKLSPNGREDIQFYLKECLTVLNKLFASSLVFPVVFSAGDEVQGLFHSTSAAYLYTRWLDILLAPIFLRSAIGTGQWETRILNGTSTEQDGSVYHRTRDALALIKQKKQSALSFCTDNSDLLLINQLSDAINLISGQQSSAQRYVYMLSELCFPLIDNSQMNLQVWPKLANLLKMKRKIFSETKLDSNWPEPAIEGQAMPICPIILDNVTLEMTSPSEVVWRHGFISQMVESAGKSRQNLEKLLNLGEIIRLRQYAAAMYFAIDRRGKQI